MTCCQFHGIFNQSNDVYVHILVFVNAIFIETKGQIQILCFYQDTMRMSPIGAQQFLGRIAASKNRDEMNFVLTYFLATTAM